MLVAVTLCARAIALSVCCALCASVGGPLCGGVCRWLAALLHVWVFSMGSLGGHSHPTIDRSVDMLVLRSALWSRELRRGARRRRRSSTRTSRSGASSLERRSRWRGCCACCGLKGWAKRRPGHRRAADTSQSGGASGQGWVDGLGSLHHTHVVLLAHLACGAHQCRSCAAHAINGPEAAGRRDCEACSRLAAHVRARLISARTQGRAGGQGQAGM